MGKYGLSFNGLKCELDLNVKRGLNWIMDLKLENWIFVLGNKNWKMDEMDMDGFWIIGLIWRMV